jgi:hypothetical protein
MPITELVHDDLGMVNAYLLDHAEKDDVLIGSHYVNYVEWQGKPEFAQMYLYSISELSRSDEDGYFYIAGIIEEHPSGWIILDEQALDFAPPSLPMDSVVVRGKTVEYAGKFITQHVWHWGVK